MKTILLALLLFINTNAQILLYDDFSLNDIPGLQLLILPNRDLAGGWTSDNKVVQDYSQGGRQYGSELVTNGGFDTDSDWLNTGANWIIEDGVAKKVTTTSISLYQEILEVGKYYRLELDNIVDGKTVYLYNGSPTFLGSTVGRKIIEFQALQTQLYITFLTQSGGQIDNVSVKEITNGSHGLYKNSMELNQTAGLKYYTFDGTDDYISLGDVLNLQDNFTVMCLFKSAIPGGATRIVIGKGNTYYSTRSYYIGIYLSKLVSIFSSNGAAGTYNIQSVGDANEFFDNTPHLYGVSKIGSTYVHSVDGIQKTYVNSGTETEPSTLHDSDGDVTIGAYLSDVSSTPTGFVNSTFRLGAIIVANSVLTPAQQKQIYYSVEVQSIIAGM